ncbi:MAG: ATP-binding protein [Nanoarchaeota archaeon]|nr:ATP-binding protein [Nanoarchaeota archaeon]
MLFFSYFLDFFYYRFYSFSKHLPHQSLKPVSFFDLKEFFPGRSAEELVNIYGFADGIPFYLIKIDREFWGWLKEELLREKGFLRDEVDFLMKLEFEDAGTYKLILQAVANGKTTINEIKDFIKVQRTDLSPYIKNLIEIGFIKREVSITENQKSRKGRYYLNDNFLKFWFRYIYSNLSSIEQGIFKLENIKKDYPSYLGYIFEDICKQRLIESKIFNFSKIGRWWHKDKEIDLVALDGEKEEILLGECKWQDNVSAEKIVKELEEKSKFVEWRNDKRKETFVIFAKSFKKKIKEIDGRKVYCFDLESIEK